MRLFLFQPTCTGPGADNEGELERSPESHPRSSPWTLHCMPWQSKYTSDRRGRCLRAVVCKFPKVTEPFYITSVIDPCIPGFAGHMSRFRAKWPGLAMEVYFLLAHSSITRNLFAKPLMTCHGTLRFCRAQLENHCCRADCCECPSKWEEWMQAASRAAPIQPRRCSCSQPGSIVMPTLTTPCTSPNISNWIAPTLLWFLETWTQCS